MLRLSFAATSASFMVPRTASSASVQRRTRDSNGGQADVRKGFQELPPAKSRFIVLSQAQPALDLCCLAADGVFAGLEKVADRAERQMHRLAAVEKEIHAGDDVRDGRGPHRRFAEHAI